MIGNNILESNLFSKITGKGKRYLKGRIWEIDCIRGIAIILMILFHLIVDLRDFYNYPLSYLSGFWYYEGKLSATLFIFIAGLSSALCRRQLKRGLIVLLWAAAISVVTYVYNAETYIRFGILHLLGSCMILYHYAQAIPSHWLVVAGTAALSSRLWLAKATASSALLLPLGLTPETFISMDYYPLLPWSGLFLYGAAFGKTVYAGRQSRLPYIRQAEAFAVLGRRSLLIYLVHQPILLALLWLYHAL